MLPTLEQIGVAAYHRWEQRGGTHGRDRDDWLVAEHDLLFAENYEVAAYHELSGAAVATVGTPRRRVCRFCEQAAPQASFREREPTLLPRSIGGAFLRTYEECDDCRGTLAEGPEPALEEFLSRLRSPGFARNRPPARLETPLSVFKALTRLALALVPRGDLSGCEDAIEWVVNADIEFDAGLFRGLGGALIVPERPAPHPWLAVARRRDDAAPVPALLVFLGTPEHVLEFPVPLCVRDEDLDGPPQLPHVPSPLADERSRAGWSSIELSLALPRKPLARRWRLDALLDLPFA